MLFNLDFVKNMNKKIEGMNKGKKGRRYIHIIIHYFVYVIKINLIYS